MEVDADRVLGLLKLLLDFGGRAHIGDLAKALHLTWDEVYHVLETAESLGAVKIGNNEVGITTRGLELLRMRFGDIHNIVRLKAEELGTP